ncbi:MAG TPA: RecX family transcriptional regulator [Candidatus Saccharimonadales bacterium]|nr:RecX family transcriptional regulator [Candidatus Saccharimonadales bacterium]
MVQAHSAGRDEPVTKKITGLKVQVKNLERVSVFVDGKYSFSLNQNQLLDLKLRVGLEVTDQEIENFKRASDFGKNYERALIYVMIRPRSTKEVRDYFKRKKVDHNDAELIIDKLKAKRYLSDENFARSWIENRNLGKKTSARKLKMELKQKGLSESLINEALSTSNFSEDDALKNLIAKKRKNVKFAADPQKLMQYLARQGFGFDEIKQAMFQD